MPTYSDLSSIQRQFNDARPGLGTILRLFFANEINELKEMRLHNQAFNYAMCVNAITHFSKNSPFADVFKCYTQDPHGFTQWLRLHPIVLIANALNRAIECFDPFIKSACPADAVNPHIEDLQKLLRISIETYRSSVLLRPDSKVVPTSTQTVGECALFVERFRELTCNCVNGAYHDYKTTALQRLIGALTQNTRQTQIGNTLRDVTKLFTDSIELYGGMFGLKNHALAELIDDDGWSNLEGLLLHICHYIETASRGIVRAHKYVIEHEPSYDECLFDDDPAAILMLERSIENDFHPSVHIFY